MEMYKNSVFSNSSTIYNHELFKIDLVRQDEGILIKITNLDEKKRIISIDESLPGTEVRIGWDSFGNGKFLANCKIITQQL